MFLNLLLNVLYGIFVLQSVMKDLTPTLPIGCVWQEHAENDGVQPNKVLSVVGTIAVIAVTVILFALSTWYLHMRRQRWGKIVRSVGLILLMALAVGAAVRVIMVSAAFGSPSIKLSGPSEASWSFGQLLTMLVLILPFISALEIFRGKWSRFGRCLFSDTNELLKAKLVFPPTRYPTTNSLLTGAS
jgi:ACR3 family arsenite efflux pump ArsB